MHLIQVLAIVSSAALVAAVPAPVADDVVIYDKDTLEELEKLRNSDVVPPKPSYLDDTLVTLPVNESAKAAASTLQKRATTIIIPNPKVRFLGWDEVMSQVVKGPVTVSVAKGRHIKNSITVSQGASFTLVKDFLEATVSVDYTQEWEYQETHSYSVPVPEGQWGALVSNAWTNRESGNVWTGTIGGEGSLTYYQADSFEQKGHSKFHWVNGHVSMCNSTHYPVHRCIGEGYL